MHSWRLVTQETATPSPHWSPRATLHPATPLPRTGAPSYSLWATTSTTCIDFSFQKVKCKKTVSDTPVPTLPGSSAGSETDPKSKRAAPGRRTVSLGQATTHTDTCAHTDTHTQPPAPHLQKDGWCGYPRVPDPSACDPPAGSQVVSEVRVERRGPQPLTPTQGLLPGQTQSW